MVTAVSEPGAVAPSRGRLRVAWQLITATLVKAWNDRVLGLAAEAGFWQLLSLPSLLLAVLGFIGYFSGALGPDTLHSLENAILRGAKHVIVPSSVDSTIKPALHRILVGGRADVVSISFIVSLWTGSSAMATYVNTITIAYGLRAHRNAVRSRLLALLLYFGFVAVGVVLLPLLVLGPSLVVKLFPDRWQHLVHTLTVIGYWPVVAIIGMALLTTLYHLAVPVRLPWRRAVPGAMFALVVWLAGSTLLREWLAWAFRSTATYGPLSAPVAVLVFLYLTALAILLGAELNAEIDRLWPSRATAEARRSEEAAARAGAAT
ncbi:MAG: rane protein [Frankiaceae bacterium]|nr:rane protein [Frankiaceae bacterium]